MPPVISADALLRRFGARTAVDGLTFAVHAGDIVGCVGPNGAGKTTTIRLLNGVLTPTSGRASVLGYDPIQDGTRLRRRTGVLTEGITLYEHLTARQNLRFSGALFGMEGARLDRRIDEMLDLLGLRDRENDPAGTLSTGLKKRLSIARAILHDPEILYLDEPTASLDPESARQVTDLVGRLSTLQGRTVFLATHDLAEAERLSTHVMILRAGRLAVFGTREEVLGSLGPLLAVTITLETEPAARVLEALGQATRAQAGGPSRPVFVVPVRSQADIPEIIRDVVEAGGRILEVAPARTTLEDVYFHLQDAGDGAGSTPRPGTGDPCAAARSS